MHKAVRWRDEAYGYGTCAPAVLWIWVGKVQFVARLPLC